MPQNIIAKNASETMGSNLRVGHADLSGLIGVGCCGRDHEHRADASVDTAVHGFVMTVLLSVEPATLLPNITIATTISAIIDR